MAGGGAMTGERPGRAAAGSAVRLDGVTRRFGPLTAVDRCTLEVPPGAFVTILGPSGCGKTTLLNLVAGFLAPDEGEILFDGRPITAVPSHRRGIGMVFQSFALFPHMSVRDNVAFPLRMRERALGRAEIARRAEAALGLVRLAALTDRRPAQLSGGQKQRVAMARALVSRPRLLLLDEPLSALDKNLREEMQVELKSLHRQAGSTFICVTHDQQEALALSDLVVVMRDGRIEQCAAPETLYQRPSTSFVARFLGGANILPGAAAGAPADGQVDVGDGERLYGQAGQPLAPGAPVEVVFRPEAVALEAANGQPPSDPQRNRLRARVAEAVFLGDWTKLVAERRGCAIAVKLPAAAVRQLQPGTEVVLSWTPAETLLMPAEAKAG
jgi:ABC-type Fe3+/spermidine/putrescine transport system ATPase subunit